MIMCTSGMGLLPAVNAKMKLMQAMPHQVMLIRQAMIVVTTLCFYRDGFMILPYQTIACFGAQHMAMP